MNETIQQDYKHHYVIEKLTEHGYTDIEGKTYEELKRKLAAIRAMEVDVTADSNKWF